MIAELQVVGVEVGLPVVKDVVRLLLGGFDHCLVADHDGLNAFDAYVGQARVSIHGVDHVCHFLETFAECIKLPKDIVLTIE